MRKFQYILSLENFIFMDFSAVDLVTGSDVKVGANGKCIDYSSIWHYHLFRIKNSLRNRGNTGNNEKVVYFSVANIVSYQKRSYLASNFANLASEKVHEDEIFGQQDLLQVFSWESSNLSLYTFIH